jgi:hypothetical protein
MESDSYIVNSFSEDNLENSKIDLNIKTLNPEKDVLDFLEQMNFKLISNNISYPKVTIIKIYNYSLYSIYMKFL